MVAAFTVIVEPAAAITFTVRRTVHVVLGAMLPFWWHTICPVPRYGGVEHVPSPGRPGDADVVKSGAHR